MLPFLVVFGVVGILVVCGVAISLYLFNRGALGRRSRRSRPVDTDTISDETVTDEQSGEQAITVSSGNVDVTSRYARKSIIVFFGGLLVIGILLITIFNAIRH